MNTIVTQTHLRADVTSSNVSIITNVFRHAIVAMAYSTAMITRMNSIALAVTNSSDVQMVNVLLSAQSAIDHITAWTLRTKTKPIVHARRRIIDAVLFNHASHRRLIAMESVIACIVAMNSIIALVVSPMHAHHNIVLRYYKMLLALLVPRCFLYNTTIMRTVNGELLHQKLMR
jgi:hypothetical protein